MHADQYASLCRELDDRSDPIQAANLSRFFKTGPGQYGEGDRFLGIKVPVLRTLARQNRDLTFTDIEKLLASPCHEYRQTALFILVLQFAKSKDADRKRIYEFYLSHRQSINNWDLVDVTTPRIVGGYLLDHPDERSILYTYAHSGTLWERRIAIMATAAFLDAGSYEDTFAIADILLHDPHDLIHKAVGWMLREIGKRDLPAEETFLKSRYQTMPRTMLRYATEKFEETKRQRYLKGSI